MHTNKNSFQSILFGSRILIAFALAFTLALSMVTAAFAAPRTSDQPIAASLVTLSPNYGYWGAKVTIHTDSTVVSKKRVTRNVTINTIKTPTVATSFDGGKSYTFTLETLCNEAGICPKTLQVSGDLQISLRNTLGNTTNSLSFTLVQP